MLDILESPVIIELGFAQYPQSCLSSQTLVAHQLFPVLLSSSIRPFTSLSLSLPSRISRAIFLFVGCTLDFDHRLATWDTMGDCQLLQTRKGRRVFDRSHDDRLGTPSSDFQALSHSVSLNER